MNEYLVIYENAGSNWSAYVPDLPGCITTGRSLDECKENIREAIQVYMEAAVESGEALPQPTTVGEYLPVTRSA